MGSADAGYAIHEAVFTAAEIDALLAAIESQPIRWSRAGARHVLACAPIAAIARDARLIRMASAWLGATAVPFRATLFNKDPDANWLVAWHQDTALPLESRRAAAGWGPWSSKKGITYAHAPASALGCVIALRIHLDESSADNGPLRVLPGTHVLGVLSDEQVHEHARRVQFRECRAPAGAVVAMRPLLIHASSKSRTSRPRRVLHVEYAGSMEIAPGMRLHAA